MNEQEQEEVFNLLENKICPRKGEGIDSETCLLVCKDFIREEVVWKMKDKNILCIKKYPDF